MSQTFEVVREESVLKSRLGFASSVMKLELIAASFGMKRRVGEASPSATDPSRYVYKFRAYERREDDESDSEDGYEGDFDEGGSDPFQPPVPSTTQRLLAFVHEMRAELNEKHNALMASVDWARLGGGQHGRVGNDEPLTPRGRG